MHVFFFFFFFNVKNPTCIFVERMEQLSDFFKMLQNKDKNKSQFIYISSLGRVSKSELVRKYIVEYSKKSYDNRII